MGAAASANMPAVVTSMSEETQKALESLPEAARKEILEKLPIKKLDVRFHWY